jgi:Tfp pilus assembly protein PilP
MILLKYLTFLLFISMNSIVLGQQESKNLNREKLKERMSTIPVFNEKETSIKNPFDLRDPFKRKLIKTGEKVKNYGGFLKEGKYSNLPTINNFPVSNIRIVGVLLGKERRAIAKVVSGSAGGSTDLSDESYIVKEGMILGENNAEVKAIVPGGIVLVEKIRNVYDQDEYIETIIPVSSQTQETNRRP